MNTSLTQKVLTDIQDKIGHYRILRKLGQGGMSVVYEALDEKLKRSVAIKVLHPFLAEGDQYRARFLREALAVARLTHPNIVQIFDVANPENPHEQLYIVTELILGTTLKEFQKRLHLIELPELSAMIIWQIAHALEHAHERGIIHRDIKPENIMVCGDGQLKLMDFGIASLGNEESLTHTGSLLGSLGHLSPEVIKGHRATRESDVFSLCTVFFWMLTGKMPFVGDSPHALLKAIVDEPHQKVQRLSAYISDDLAAIVDMGMQKDPRARFRSMSLLASAIEQALLKMGIAVDIKEMQSVLRDPSTRFLPLKNMIYEQINRQLKLLNAEHRDTQALALACRLEAVTLNTKEKPRNKFSPLKTGRVILSLLFVLVTLFFGLRPKTLDPSTMEKSLVVKPEDPVEEKTIEIETNETEARAEQIKESKPQPIAKKPVVHETLKDVTLVVWPFANIYVDDRLMGNNLKSLSLKLPAGTHKLTFTHSYAATIEKIINIPHDQDQLEMKIQLIKSKPAFLRIRTNIDADVAIDGNFKGSTQKSVGRPIVIPMPDKTHSQIKEVLVSQPGYEPYIANVEFIAGETREIEITLKKDSRAF